MLQNDLEQNEFPEIEFPEIDYKYWVEEWEKETGGGETYMNKNIKKYIEFHGTIKKCSKKITRLVKKKRLSRKKVLKVADLIHIWGGPSSRMFYVEKEEQPSSRALLESENYEMYLKGAIKARKGKAKSQAIFNNVRGIGLAYSSKHSHFWSLKSKKHLIIIDSKVAGALGFATIERVVSEITYNRLNKFFRQKAVEVLNTEDATLIEQALFAFHNRYFKNDNTGWKNSNRNSESKDLTAANLIAYKLFNYSENKE